MTRTLLLAATHRDGERFRAEYPHVPIYRTVTMQNLRAARGLTVNEIAITDAALAHPHHDAAMAELGPCCAPYEFDLDREDWPGEEGWKHYERPSEEGLR